MAQWTGVSGKRVLMTGATRGIGLAAAKELARRGARLAIVARDERRGQAAAAEIAGAARQGAAVEAAPDVGIEPPASAGERSDARATQVDVLTADLTLQSSVRELAQQALERYPRIDVLVNNAGAMFTSRQMTSEGVERTWALNHLAPFLLTNLLCERLKDSAPARVITTASRAHQGNEIPFDDLAAERSYRRLGFERYGQTKLANILFTAELARRLQGSGVSAYCFHPGLVATGFNRNNGPLSSLAMIAIRPFSRSPEHGARTLVWLADTPDLDGEGGYFSDEKLARPSRAGQDLDAAARLWEVSERQTGLAQPAGEAAG
jgi:NAD(P)-dependent dehydrogenase (short-subunit alcohol dehydrogenase family)